MTHSQLCDDTSSGEGHGLGGLRVYRQEGFGTDCEQGGRMGNKKKIVLKKRRLLTTYNSIPHDIVEVETL